MIITLDNTETFVGDLERYARERAGVHRTTVMRWRHRGWPPLLLRLAAIELGGHLGFISPTWRGWRLERKTGELFAPADYKERPYRPEHLIAAPMLHQLQRELDRQRAARPRSVVAATDDVDRMRR